MSTPQQWLVPPADRRQRVRSLARAILLMARIELTIRRRDVQSLCRAAGIEFMGFDAVALTPTALHIDVPNKWWSAEVVLRRWPWGRRRQCLRRSLLLGTLLQYRDPALCLEARSVRPLDVHAWLLVGGHRFDMGDAGPIVASVGVAAP